MPYDPELPDCFGHDDLVFASSDLTCDRAFGWLTKLREQEAVWADVEHQIQEFLRERGVNVLRIVEQVDRARAMLGPWLYGVDQGEGDNIGWTRGQ